MATGESSYFDLDCTSYLFKIRVNWSETYDASTNSSVVTVTSLQFKSTGWYGFTYYPNGVVKVNGDTVISMNSVLGDHNCRSDRLDEWSTVKKSNGEIATGSTTVIHNDDGSKNITIEVTGRTGEYCRFYIANDENVGGNGWGCSGSSTVSLTTISTYSLSISADTGSTITVNRTSSGYVGANTGNIVAGTRLYYGDKLKITFSPKTNYRLLTTTVNGSAFTSGNTHAVAADVVIASTAQVLASAVGATDANIGSTSTITVTKYNTAYYHSLQYSFGSLSGYITSSGGVQSSETKFRGSSVAFNVPTTFYSQIVNTKTGTCTITCRTYSSESSTAVLGNATRCTFTVTAASQNCAPTLSVSVVDTNPTTKALTGNDSHLIKYMSTAKCTINATSRHSATITSMLIAGSNVTGSTSGDVTTATKSFANTDKESFQFTATDSRGYTTRQTVSPTVVKYIKLTCNPEITRPTPTGSSMVMSFAGNVYRGSFGAYSNTLTLKYRYKVEGGSYGSWQTIDSTNIVFGTSTYRSGAAITLQDEFDYHKSYEFQVRATDGAGDYTLSTVTATVQVQSGVPVFDWGEDDFNVNVSLMLNNVNILDIMYPVGAVYMHSSNALPTTVSNVGIWERISTGISGVYAWKRTE